MRHIVCKFGGSSTANAAHLEKILTIVRASPARRFIVLSAPGTDPAHDDKVTDMLQDCWENRHIPHALDLAVSRVEWRFSELYRGLSVPEPVGETRREILNAVSISLPHTLSMGEYLCARLFSRTSGMTFVDAAKVIATDDRGDVDEALTARNFQRLLQRDERIVIPGFYGSDRHGRIHTFQRNGSDISGALAAAGSGAGLYENWTDVDGLLTADPAIVPEARLIPQISYRQMRAISRAGAKVLHPDSLDPVAMSGIPTRLRNTLNPDCFGTLIDEHTHKDVPCIVGKPDSSLPKPLSGQAARISVFGITPRRVTDAAKVLEPLCLREKQNAVEVYVPETRYADTLRRLHAALIG